MNSTTAPGLWSQPDSPLTRCVTAPEFGEHHARVIDAPIEACWDALLRLRWQDVPGAGPLLRVRGLGSSGRLAIPVLELFDPVCVRTQQPPHSAALAMIGRPWSPVPRSRRPESFDQVRDFAEPGWLKYGMDWTLTALTAQRTLVETRTLCEPTDDRARRNFRRYWRMVGPFSGLLRAGMLRGVARLARIQADPN